MFLLILGAIARPLPPVNIFDNRSVGDRNLAKLFPIAKTGINNCE
jgi:hypothetical protein